MPFCLWEAQPLFHFRFSNIQNSLVHEGSWLYLFAVVGCVGHTHQVFIRPAIQVCVLSADDAIACVAGLALTAIHGVAVVTQVVALGILVAVMCPVCAGVSRFAHLKVQQPNAITGCLKVPSHPRVQIPSHPETVSRPIWEKDGILLPLSILFDDIQAIDKC